LKLIHTTQYYWPSIGGAENYCQTISEELANEHKVTVYTTDLISGSPSSYATNLLEYKNGVTISRIPSLRILPGIYGRKKLSSRSSPLFKVLSSLDTPLTWPQALLERAVSSSIPHKFFWLTKSFKNADLVVSFNMITGMTSLSYLATRVAKKPFVVFPFYHVGLWSYERPSLFKILRDANLVICSTDYEKHALINHGLDSRKLRVVNEGVKPPKVEDKVVKNLEPVLGRREGSLLLMYVGRRHYDKGYLHVLSAVAHLVRKGVPIKLIVAGYGEIGANRESYIFLSKNNAIVDLGVPDEQTKNAAMSLSDVIILPSRVETYPLVFVESWFLGKPVIGARIESVSSMVREGVCGLLVDFGDVSGLADRIQFLFENPEKRVEMGEYVQAWARQELTLEKTVAKVKKILNGLAEGLM
jgi:glycosyltransferase involved in cell wall biosynthesis